MSDSEQTIGLLGGTFDPVHNGHISIAQSFLSSGLISELWILLTPDPPHKKENKLNAYRERMEMLKAAFRTIIRVRVSDLEATLPRPSYTVQTLEYLQEKYPQKKFYLCLGEDSLQDFKQWKDWEKILDYCELLVARRPNTKAKQWELGPKLASKTHFVDHHPIETSSTEIRNRISEGRDISHLVPKEVKKIIEQKNLYRN